MPENERKDRSDEATELPEEKDRDYGPYGQQRPGRRPDADEEQDDKREEAWQNRD